MRLQSTVYAYTVWLRSLSKFFFIRVCLPADWRSKSLAASCVTKSKGIDPVYTICEITRAATPSELAFFKQSALQTEVEARPSLHKVSGRVAVVVYPAATATTTMSGTKPSKSAHAVRWSYPRLLVGSLSRLSIFTRATVLSGSCLFGRVTQQDLAHLGRAFTCIAIFF
jgi:hypothetical protein